MKPGPVGIIFRKDDVGKIWVKWPDDKVTWSYSWEDSYRLYPPADGLIEWPEDKEHTENCYGKAVNNTYLHCTCEANGWNAAIDACKEAVAKAKPCPVPSEDEILKIIRNHVKNGIWEITELAKAIRQLLGVKE